MKKILFVITKSNWGGAQKYVFDLATAIPKNQFEVKVAAGGEGAMADKLKARNIEVVKIPSMEKDISFLKEIESFFQLLKIYRKEKPDVVHLNGSKAGGLGALAARLSGIEKIIFTVHGFAFNEERPRVQRLLIKALSYGTLLLSTNIIFINKKELASAQQWPMIHRKCHLIYNGLKSPSFIDRENARRFIAEKIEKHSSFFDGKQAVGSIGELTKNKGYGRAIEAFSKTPEGMVYIIVGNGELYNELARQIKNNNLGEKIFLTGFLDNASSLLKAFDIFLLPSIKEGLPYVLLEAGYAGLPVIAAAVGGVPEIIEDQKTGVLAAPDNASDLTQKLSELAANTPFKEKIARAFQEKVGKNFSLEQMLSDTIKLYEADHFVRR